MNFTIADIVQALPHRAPFLFIDKVTNIIPGTSGTGIKLVTANDAWLTGNQMTLPSSFYVEIMAQTCAMICYALPNGDHLRQGYLAGFNLDTHELATAGDCIEAHVAIIKIWGTLILATGTITVKDKEIAQGRFTIGLIEPLDV